MSSPPGEDTVGESTSDVPQRLIAAATSQARRATNVHRLETRAPAQRHQCLVREAVDMFEGRHSVKRALALLGRQPIAHGKPGLDGRAVGHSDLDDSGGSERLCEVLDRT